MKTIVKIGLGIVLGFVLLIGGCAALIGGAASEVDKQMKEEAKESTSGKQSVASSDDKKSAAKNVIGNWTIENFNSIKFTEEYGSFATIPLKVRNSSDEADSPWFDIRLTDKRGDLVAEFTCIGNEFEPGQGGTVDCSTLDDFGPFKDWEIKDAF
ncbi:unannotated protein [freshwater metagenome]|uniref:Unannotated protein n=1 Tax=freshwater metagenome TaxID=449393 RepID=A0A6J7JCM7_9ZZZZ|nr:hypothetical protein [Actinomycetota bacterium]